MKHPDRALPHETRAERRMTAPTASVSGGRDLGRRVFPHERRVQRPTTVPTAPMAEAAASAAVFFPTTPAWSAR
jgi:hypothetical protein